jgi:hypothetical protein
MLLPTPPRCLQGPADGYPVDTAVRGAAKRGRTRIG